MTETTATTARGHGRLVATALALVMLLAACNWTQFRADPGHSGNQPLEFKIGTTNVAALSESWTATTGGNPSSPAVANGVAYVGSPGGLYAFDAAGVTNCSGIPKSCTPLWTSYPNLSFGSPAVVNGVVYVARYYGSSGHTLEAFDAAGVTNCSGVPKRCAPLWTASINGGLSLPPLTVANGVVYVSSDDRLSAFDAGGVTNCSGIPKSCAPLWTASNDGYYYSSPAVANGVVYVGSGDGKLYAFDAAGANCSGIPKSCAPLWTTFWWLSTYSSPAVVNGVVYVGSGSGLGKLHAFDAAGVTNCSGIPKICAPLWTASDGGSDRPSPAVANGVVYVGSGDGKLYAFDAGTGMIKWTAAGDGILGAPAVANGVVYVGSTTGRLYAFDAAGETSCSGTPKTCTSLWSARWSAFTSGNILPFPAVANGMVYVAGEDGKLHAFGLPPV